MTDRRDPRVRHSVPALTAAPTGFDRRFLADGDLAGDETYLNLFPSLVRTHWCY